MKQTRKRGRNFTYNPGMISRYKRHLWIHVLMLLLAALTLGSCGQTESPDSTSTPLPTLVISVDNLSNSDLKAAQRSWQEIIDRDPENPEAHYHLGLILLLSDPDEAFSHLERSASLEPGFARPVSRLKSALRQAAAIDDPAYNLTLTGQALASIDEWYLAEIALDRAVSEDPEYAEAWAYLGESRQHTDSEEALPALETAYALKPDSIASNLFLSMYYRRDGQPLKAMKFLEAAIEQDPQNKDLLADLAQTLVEAGGVSKGFGLLEEMVKESPADTENWLRLARLSMDNNLQVTESGLPAARQALLLAPDNPEAALLLGRGYLFLGEKVLAERFLVQTLALDDQNPEAHYYLAILYLNTGQTDKAQSHFLEADILAQEAGNTDLSEQVTKLLAEYFDE